MNQIPFSYNLEELESSSTEFKIHADENTVNLQGPLEELPTVVENLKYPDKYGRNRAKFYKKVRRQTPYSHGKLKYGAKLKIGDHDTPSSVLNRLKPQLKVQVEAVRGAFVASIRDDEVEFIGSGSSKKLAMHNAASHALQCYQPALLLAVKKDWNEKFMLNTASSKEKTTDGEVDFTSDDACFTDIRLMNKIDEKITLGVQQPLLSIKEKLLNDFERKHPITLLNELCSQVAYKDIEKDQFSNFKVHLDLGGDEVYFGIGKSKKQARTSAAIEALRVKYLIEHEPWQKMLFAYGESKVRKIKAKELKGNTESNNNTAEDNISKPADGVQAKNAPVENIEVENSKGENAKVHNFKTAENKNPVMILHNHVPGLKWTLKSQNDAQPDAKFVMEATVKGVLYHGSGKSKKEAKADGAVKALKEQFDIEICNATKNEKNELLV